MLSTGLVMGVLILPLIASMCEDALSAVPRNAQGGGLRHGSDKTGSHDAGRGSGQRFPGLRPPSSWDFRGLWAKR